MDQKDYGRAEAAFKSHLALVRAQPNPKPQDLLGVHNPLGMVYYWSGNIENRKECLRQAIALHRTIHGGDSVQEAECWQRLADITHDSGDAKEAVVMLDRAIKMYSDLHDQTVQVSERELLQHRAIPIRFFFDPKPFHQSLRQ
jgi:tetratricopeptide (TPR) repeat protein